MPSAAIESARQAAFEVLHAAGWVDTRIGRALRAAPSTVQSWRAARNLEPNRPHWLTFDEEHARRLYNEGETDCEIARQLGVHRTTIRGWRVRRQLESRHVTEPSISRADKRQARGMLKAGATKRQVAEALGLSGKWARQKIQKIRRGMQHPGLRAASLNNRTVRAAVLRDHSIRPRIERAIGNLPRDVREEAVAELYLAVLEGRVLSTQIEAQAPHFRNKAWDLMGSAFGPRSLEAENDDGWSLADILDDPDALESLEAAAELAYEMDD